MKTTTTTTTAKHRPGRPAKSQNAITATTVDWKLLRDIYTSNLPKTSKANLIQAILS